MSSNTQEKTVLDEMPILETDEIEEENQLTLQLKLQDELKNIFQMQEMVKEMKEKIDISKDVVREIFEKLGGHEVFAELENGGFAKVHQRITIREKLDKDSLANTLKVSKDELKTPFDFSKFTAKGDLTPKMITEHTETETKTNLKIVYQEHIGINNE